MSSRRLVAGLMLALASPVAAFAADACANLTRERFADLEVTVQSAVRVPAGPAPRNPNEPPGASPTMLPAHCRVEGVIEPRTGRNGKPYGIGFAVALPANWNGRFLMQGGGGLNGVLLPPLGAQAAGDSPALARGFAVASTDSGHRASGGFDGSFLEDQEATLNFLFGGVAKTTQVAKRLVAAYYRKPAAHSYFVGCSTGGREAMMMSQRYPAYFDGIVAGAPATRTNYSNLALRWIGDALDEVAPRDPQGKPQTALALSPPERKLVVDGLLEACDALDGRADGMIFNVRGCRFDPAVLACRDGRTERCLAPAKAEAVRKAFSGPRTPGGTQVYPGFFYDTGIETTPGKGLPGLLQGPFIPEQLPSTAGPLSVEARAAAAHDARSMAGDTNAWTNLSGFHGRGGKLIFFHGVSDPWFSAQETVQYYERLAADNAPARTEDWSRLFLVPGMGHCRGGEATLDNFDLLEPLVAWVEQKKPPESVVATGAVFPGRSRPLCPWPKSARWGGAGDAEKAATWRCE